jgi:adenylate cyclase
VPGFAMLEAGAVTLRGRAERIPLFLLVGEDTLTETGAFKLLRQSHNEALAALRDGRDARGAIAECTALGMKLEPGLRSFYERLPQRAADFRPLQAVAE